VLELTKKIPIKTGYYKIDKKTLWISEKKIMEEKIKSEIKKYRFNLKVAYKFSSINGIKILSALLFTTFHSKTDIPLEKLYKIIKEKVYKKFKEATLDKYIEDKGYTMNGAPFEQYITDPGMESDTSKWQTNIYFPVK
jgi:hypothetical protein